MTKKEKEIRADVDEEFCDAVNKDKWNVAVAKKYGKGEKEMLAFWHYLNDSMLWHGWLNKNGTDIDAVLERIKNSAFRFRLLLFRFRLHSAWERLIDDSWAEDFYFWCCRTWRKYVTDPLFRRKMKRQRYKRGFSDNDWWNLDHWMSDTLAKAIETLADNTMSCPGCVEALMAGANPRTFKYSKKNPTDEEWNKRHEWWVNHLKEIAFLLRESNEDTCSCKNEEEFFWNSHFEKSPNDPYYSTMVDDCTPDQQEQNKRHFKREDELEAYREDCFRKAMLMLSNLHGMLWD